MKSHVITLDCLEGNDVINAQVSDHHPMMHDGVLFWNIMMKGGIRESGDGYNNGFGLKENEEDYIKRLHQIGAVIAEMVERYPALQVISLCEGPIQPLHVNALLYTLKNAPSMNRFFKDSVIEDGFHRPEVQGPRHWGLLMLADRRYRINKLDCEVPLFNRLFTTKSANRFQLWHLSEDGKNKYLALAHFPFGGDEYKTKKEDLSHLGNLYCEFINQLLNQYANDSFIFCADFNFSPYLINTWQDRALDKIANNNSVLLTQAGNRKAVTVDGILLSQLEKQKYHASIFNLGLFSCLNREKDLMKSYIKTQLMDHPMTRRFP